MLLKATNKKKHLFSRFLFLFGFILFQPPYFSVFCNPSGVLYQNSRAHTFFEHIHHAHTPYPRTCLAAAAATAAPIFALHPRCDLTGISRPAPGAPADTDVTSPSTGTLTGLRRAFSTSPPLLDCRLDTAASRAGLHT